MLSSPADLDMTLSPSGKVIKSAGESLDLTLQTDASGEPKVSWTKVWCMAGTALVIEKKLVVAGFYLFFYYLCL